MKLRTLGAFVLILVLSSACSKSVDAPFSEEQFRNETAKSFHFAYSSAASVGLHADLFTESKECGVFNEAFSKRCLDTLKDHPTTLKRDSERIEAILGDYSQMVASFQGENTEIGTCVLALLSQAKKLSDDTQAAIEWSFTKANQHPGWYASKILWTRISVSKKIQECESLGDKKWGKDWYHPSKWKWTEPKNSAGNAAIPLPNIQQLTREAENGDSSSQLELAVYYEGKLYQNTPNIELAHKWFYEAAKQDNYLAQLGLASLGFKASRSIFEGDFSRIAASGSNSGQTDAIVDAIAWYEVARLGAKKAGTAHIGLPAENEFISKYQPSAELKSMGSQQALRWRAQQFREGETTISPDSERPSLSAPPVKSSASDSLPVMSSNALVEAIVNASKADRFADITSPKLALDALPKPGRGDRKAARERNFLGLDALKNSDFNTAIDRFTEGQKADPSDIELVNNLGYALMMAGKSGEAKDKFVETLTIDSSRGAAWSNLGQLHARMGDVNSAAACFKLTYLFSRAPEKTIEFYKKLAESDTDEKIRAAATKASSEFSNIQPLITTVRYQYQKVLDSLSLGPTGYSSPSSKIVELLSNPSSQDDWKFINELEVDLGQCSTGSACARETEITQAQDNRKANGLRAQTRRSTKF